ncbi:MAG: hypothetical protein GXP13_09310 [Gammaproteobacteria bacterium]|nr:hypothetical protein [Gammaproteobacteria bacterium]
MIKAIQSGRSMLLAFLIVTLLSACGFQLRGQYSLPAGMEKVYIQGNVDGLLLRHLRQALERSGVTVVKQIDAATGVITIHNQIMGRKILSVGKNARVREYESIYKLIYSVRLKTGKMLFDKKTISLQRDFTFSENIVLGKEREETTLQHDMQYQAAQTILRRLAYQ